MKKYIILAFSFMIFLGCSEDSDTTPTKTLVASYDVALNTANSIPMVLSRS